MRKQFALEYLIDGNATQAAIRAGYAESSARQRGSLLLQNPEVRATIDAQHGQVTKKLADRYEVNADRIVRELALLGFSNMGDYVVIDDDGLPRLDLGSVTMDQTAAIKDIDVTTTTFDMGERGIRTVEKTKIRLADKRSALVDLGKTVGLFKDGGDVLVPVQFIVEWVRPEGKAA